MNSNKNLLVQSTYQVNEMRRAVMGQSWMLVAFPRRETIHMHGKLAEYFFSVPSELVSALAVPVLPQLTQCINATSPAVM